MIGIFIVWCLCGRTNPWNTQRPLHIRGIEIPLYLTAVVGIYIWRNFRNWTSLTRKRVAIVSLIILIMIIGLVLYVNYYMPHGEMIDTGYQDDRGIEVYFEDYRDLNIPDWAKVIKGNKSGVILIIFAMGLISCGLFDCNKEE